VLPPPPLAERAEAEGAMARRKPSASKVHAQQAAPTYPRLDLVPPELVIGSLASLGRVALSSNELNDEDRETVERAVRQLNELELFRLIAQVTAPAPVLKRLVEQIGTIAGAAYLIGAHGAMTETSRVFFQRGQADWMRHRRKASPEEQSLREAIEAGMKAIGEIVPPPNPYKAAERILTAVNERLAPRTVKIDAIARRLGARRKKG
jgi:hypothetical protein